MTARLLPLKLPAGLEVLTTLALDLRWTWSHAGDALWEVVRIGSWNNIPRDTVIMREGDTGDSFYLLVEGEVGVTLLGKPISAIHPGGCFGEILYFTGNTSKRTTTIVASETITAIEIKAEALSAATDACQVGFNKAFMRVLVERLSQANLKLAKR